MGIRALAAQVASFNMLLGVIPGAAGVRHHYRQHKGGNQRAEQDANQRNRRDEFAQYIALAHHRQQRHADRHTDGDNTRQQHLLDRAVGADGDAALIIRLGFAFHNAFDLAELPPHLFHDLLRRIAHRDHR